MVELTGDLPRRRFLKAAVALGGTSALSACVDRFGDEPVPAGDPAAKPPSQHAWREYIRHDEDGNSQLPRHQILLYIDFDGDGPPSADARATLEEALGVLDRAYEWSHRGLLHSIAYSPSYFDRFEASLPAAIDLPQPTALSPFESPTFDTQDAVVHLASDRAAVVLEADAALRGERETANDESVTATITDVATVDSRRTGFVGAGLPAKNQDAAGIPDSKPVPEASPLFMGFKAGFRGNQASESAVTFDDGPFAGGTTKVIANLRQRLDDWYGEQSYEDRVMELFSPSHAEQGLVEGIGSNLGDDSGIDQFVDDIERDAREFGRVGHAQKAARANRDDDGNVRLLRRHFESTDDIGSDQRVASLHFPSLQQRVSEFEAVRRAMNGTNMTEVTPAVRQRVNNGILEYIFTRRRGYFLVPPRRHRSLPTPRPE
ncbi:Tat pathway signal protein [Halonotius terrestris]|uniref:Tat pathway signal protein n=1 Tax=Halonotius terrestris TaxID=2487750 RepID=A0A8J8PAV3_9EURY|nr:Tat pathway signal protein [Halonotius terrestris]TQQ79860.1 Tat pathway signal protein [Halonotius terrestris]